MRRTYRARGSGKKPLYAALAAVIIAAVMLGGAFAWTDFTQSRVNKFHGTMDADVSMHDEFDGKNKDVFVENSGDSVIYVRVRLDEYMQAGDTVFAAGADIKDKDSWTPHTYDKDDITDCGQAEHKFHAYYQWEISGNGRGYHPGTPGMVYTTLKNGKVDEDGDGAHRTAGSSIPVTMTEFLQTVQNYEGMGQAEKDAWDIKMGNGFWILDDTGTPEDGGAWAYWSQPLKPGMATNLLLDKVTKTPEEPGDDWIYRIEVKLQAVTASDFARWDSGEKSGYKTTDGAKSLIEIWGSASTPEASETTPAGADEP